MKTTKSVDCVHWKPYNLFLQSIVGSKWEKNSQSSTELLTERRSRNADAFQMHVCKAGRGGRTLHRLHEAVGSLLCCTPCSLLTHTHAFWHFKRRAHWHAVEWIVNEKLRPLGEKMELKGSRNYVAKDFVLSLTFNSTPPSSITASLRRLTLPSLSIPNICHLLSFRSTKPT